MKSADVRRQKQLWEYDFLRKMDLEENKIVQSMERFYLKKSILENIICQIIKVKNVQLS